MQAKSVPSWCLGVLGLQKSADGRLKLNNRRTTKCRGIQRVSLERDDAKTVPGLHKQKGDVITAF